MRRLLILSATASLGFAVYLAAVWGAADYAAIKPRMLLSTLEKRGGPLGEEDFRSALEDLTFSAELNPYDPELAFDIGALHEWRALNSPSWSKSALESRAAAIGHYRRAAMLRPSWSLAWAHIAHGKALSQRLDDEAAMALEKAMVFGPWKPLIHYKVCRVGLAAWDRLDSRRREAFESLMRRSMADERLGRAIISAAFELGRGDAVAPLLESDWAKNHYDALAKKRAGE